MEVVFPGRAKCRARREEHRQALSTSVRGWAFPQKKKKIPSSPDPLSPDLQGDSIIYHHKNHRRLKVFSEF